MQESVPFALVQEIREWFDGPLLLSGAIGNGAAILAAQAWGQIWPISAPFSLPPKKPMRGHYKQAVVDSGASDIVYSNLFTGVHGNYLRSSIAAAGMDPDNLPSSDPPP